MVWGDGSNIRDFVYCDDVAASILKIIQKNITKPINIGSGKDTSIKNLVKLIVNSKNIKNKPKIIFDKTKKSGDKKRVLDTSFAESKNIRNKTKLKDGIDKTIKWYLSNQNTSKEI